MRIARTVQCGFLITSLMAGVSIGVAPQAGAYAKNGCKFSSLSVSYARTSGALWSTDISKAISSATGYWNNRVKPTFHETDVSQRPSLTFNYEEFGNTGWYGLTINNGNCNFYDGPNLNQSNLASKPYAFKILVTVHEMGHTLGLNHSSVQKSAMYTYVDTAYNLGVIGPQSDDVSGVNSIYGAQ